MTKARIPLVVAALIAAVVFAQFLVNDAINFLFLAFGPGSIESRQVPEAALLFARGAGVFLLQVLFFAAGVFLSLRYIAPVRAADGWRRTVLRGVIATFLGVAGIVVLGLVQAVLDASTVSPFPFAYAFGYSLKSEDFAQRLPQVFSAGINPLLFWVVPVVLAAVLLKVWLARRADAVTAPASDAAKPAAR